MKSQIFFIFLVLFIQNIGYSRVDLGISGGNLEITFQIVSIPFEGLNNDGIQGNNRLYEIYNGYIHRRFDPNSVPTDYPIVYHYTTGINGMTLFSCFYEDPFGTSQNAWGFAKYLIKIRNLDDPNEGIYLFYWNSLDSKMGWDNFHGRDYHCDWNIQHITTLPPHNGHLEIFESGVQEPLAIVNQFNGIDTPEVKIWKLLYPNKPDPEEPWEKNFQARTTPFPIHPQSLWDHYEQFNRLILGTTVTLGAVYDHPNEQTRYGYNTIKNFQSVFGTLDYYGNPYIISGQNSPGNTFCTPNYGDGSNWGMTIIADPGDKMIIKNNKRLWITGRDYGFPNFWIGDIIQFENGSSLEKESTAQINTCFGGKLIDYGATTVWASGSFHKAYAHSSLEYYGNLEHTVNNGGYIEIMNDGTLKLGDNTILTFDGANNPNTHLTLNSGAHVKLGVNSQIKFINGAYLDADNADFTCDNGYWQGILFENAGENTNIRNCTFSKANVALNFYNSSISSLSNEVYHNTFNVSIGGGRGISARNLYDVTFNNNTFTLSAGTIGAIVQNYSNPAEGGGEPSTVRFTNNTFNGGYIQMFIGGYAANNIPVYVYENTFNNGGWCFAGRMITGNIKYNSMSRNSSNYTMGLWQSDPNLGYNDITNLNGNAVFFSASYPVLFPLLNEGNSFVWLGGSNNISAVNGDAIILNFSRPNLDYGMNNFTISNNSYYHIYGYMQGTQTVYNARNNCWYGTSSPSHYIFNDNNIIVSVNTQISGMNCNEQINYNSYTVNNVGGGVYDTVWLSDNNTGFQAPEDEVLYTQAMEYMGNEEYFNAITNLKNLIDNYQSSSYLCNSLYDLYTCYEGLDTSDQNHRDIIFGDLKFYLSNKIEQYEDVAEFVSIAYNLILMCETMLEHYDDAMTGYEFIALYHPDPEQRIWASMDYGYIYELLNGLGGGKSNNPKRTKVNILKLMDKKPYTKIVKNTFVKGSTELAKKLNDKASNTDKQMIQKKEMIDRASQNVKLYRGMTRKQREQRRMEDIKMLIKDVGSVNVDNLTAIPKTYSLHQNYPNPFNPVTTIKYELPKDVFITFKIYDILGREIYSVNEFKKAGIYDIKFDGSKYASGIYFYRLEAGSFIETKKMVLIK